MNHKPPFDKPQAPRRRSGAASCLSRLLQTRPAGRPPPLPERGLSAERFPQNAGPQYGKAFSMYVTRSPCISITSKRACLSIRRFFAM